MGSSLVLAGSPRLSRSAEYVTHEFPPPPITTPAPGYQPVIVSAEKHLKQVDVCERVSGGEGFPAIWVMTSSSRIADAPWHKSAVHGG